MIEEILELVTKLVTEMLLQRGINVKPSPDTSLIDSGLIDSTSVVTFVADLEGAFGITISMSDMTLDNFDNITRISELVRSKLALR